VGVQLTGEKDEVLIVRREISSTLGLKTEIWEFWLVRESLLSQGDNCRVLLKKKALLDEKAIEKVKPSDTCTVVSAQGE
jgi:hypothetical protein